VSKIVGCRICLDGQLELSHNVLVDNNFEGYIADRDFVRESALDFNDSESFLFVLEDECFDLLNGEDYVIDVEEDAPSSHHVTDFE
jgi:hypothetical protein